MKLLITGAAGFTGRALASAVLAADPKAVVVGLGPRLPVSPLPDGVRWEAGSASDVTRVAGLIRTHGIDAVAHLARTTREADTLSLMRSQVGGALGLLHGVRESGGASKVLMLGSAAEYGLVEERDLPIAETRPPLPVSAYGYSKLAESTVALLASSELDVQALVARVFNPVGRGQGTSFVCGSLTAQFAEMRESGRVTPLRVGKTSPLRDFVDVRDVAEALRLLLVRGIPGECYNVGTGRGARVRDVIALLKDITGLDPQLADPASEIPAAGLQHSVADVRKLRAATGYECKTPLRDTLEQMLS